jgi:hypothetical protein
MNQWYYVYADFLLNFILDACLVTSSFHVSHHDLMFHHIGVALIHELTRGITSLDC